MLTLQQQVVPENPQQAEDVPEMQELQVGRSEEEMSGGVMFPEHKCGLYLSHNEHRDNYQTVEEFIDSMDLAGDFESPDAMARAIQTDELWELQWYPDTPVGFYQVAAPTLDEVLQLANEPRDK